MTPLHLAKDSRQDLLVFLLDHGANVTAKGKGAGRPSILRRHSGNKDAAEFLLTRGLTSMPAAGDPSAHP